MTPAEATACVEHVRVDWEGTARPGSVAGDPERGAGPGVAAAPLVPGAYWPLGGPPNPVRDSFAGVRSVDIVAVGPVIVVSLSVADRDGGPATTCLACVDVSGWDPDPHLTSSVVWAAVWRTLGSDDWRTRSATRLSEHLVVLTGLVGPGHGRDSDGATR